MNPTTREELKSILLEDILDSDTIDPVKIMKDIAIVEKGIFNSIQNGEKKYYKPARIKSIAAYGDPMKIQGIKASLVYNAVRDDSMASINLENRNTIDIIKVNIDEHEDLAREYRIMSIPTLVFFKDGNKAKEIVGFRTKEELEELIKEL